MLARIRKFAAATAMSGTLLVGLAPAAGAQPINQDGLVNVAVGGDVISIPITVGDDVISVEDVNVAVAANVAATLCDIDVGPVALAVLGQAIAVDRSGRERTICETEAGDVTIRQN
jgi:hypothetical protein